MQPTIPAFYEYFEERPFRGASVERRRNVDAFLPKELPQQFWINYIPSTAGWHHARDLEGRQHVSLDQGVWPVNYWRADRYFGDPGRLCAELVKNGDVPADTLESLAPLLRLHHYYRAHNETEIRSAAQFGIEVRLALNVTEDWSNPKGGWIEPYASGIVTGAHAIPIMDFDADLQVYPFRNSWGDEWGDRGWGYIAPSVISDNLIDAWVRVGPGIQAPVTIREGIVELFWKAGYGKQRRVHGREILDASNDKRIAWTFTQRRDPFLDVEEFFVWPTYRGRGYGTRLGEMVRQLADQMGLKLRAWIPFADCILENRPALVRTLGILGLHLHPRAYASKLGIFQDAEQVAWFERCNHSFCLGPAGDCFFLTQ